MFEKMGNTERDGAAKRFYMISCEVMQREISMCVAKSNNIIDTEFVTQAYHDLPSTEMSKKLQMHIDSVNSSRYDAILLGFALCNNGIVGLTARGIPLVIPKAHDCISLLMGSRGKYDEYFESHPGTYFFSGGWIERDSDNLQTVENSVMSKLGLDLTYQQYVDKYGKEETEYIMEALGGGLKNHYSTIALIDTGTGNIESYREFAKSEAERRDLTFMEIQGGLNFLMKLTEGDWDEKEFLVLAPGESVHPCYAGEIIKTGC